MWLFERSKQLPTNTETFSPKDVGSAGGNLTGRAGEIGSHSKLADEMCLSISNLLTTSSNQFPMIALGACVRGCSGRSICAAVRLQSAARFAARPSWPSHSAAKLRTEFILAIVNESNPSARHAAICNLFTVDNRYEHVVLSSQGNLHSRRHRPPLSIPAQGLTPDTL